MQEDPNSLSITVILRRQLTPTIDMLEDIIEQCSDDMWTATSDNVTVWQQVYHATFWLDAWARDWAVPFEKPPFHSNKALDIEKYADPVITREQMRDYLDKVKGDCMSFLDSLTDEGLIVEQEAFGGKCTPADRILGQIRHVQHHIGIIHAMIREATGAYPKWD